jgi:nucleoid DNA-binding protein
MTKSELIAKLAKHYPLLSPRDAEAAVNGILGAMISSLLMKRQAGLSNHC